MKTSLVTVIPAYCPTCKKLFHSSAFALGANVSVTIQNCKTNCPVGHEAHFLDGSYSLHDNILSIATTSPDTLRLLKDLVERAINGELDKREAAEKIVELAPALSPIFSSRSSDLLPWFALLVYLIVEIAKISLAAPRDHIGQYTPITINKTYNYQNNYFGGGSAETGTWATDPYQSKRQRRRERGKQRH